MGYNSVADIAGLSSFV